MKQKRDLYSYAAGFIAIATSLVSPALLAQNSEPQVQPRGFDIHKIYDVPKEAQGSWVSMAIDSKGRLYCADQGDKGIYRITVGGAAPVVERVPLEISSAHGMLWANESLYIVVNGGGIGGHGSGLYRVTDSNQDDQLDKIVGLRKINGGGEHGPHAVVLAPDGESLFVLGGNHTKTPNPETSAVVPNYAEDQLLPRMPDARGHAASVRAPGGWIAQTDPEGKSWRLYSTGFRNQYDVAFNADGEMFTFDSDMEWDSGTPWYRPTRIYHCTSGSEFGWRTGTGKFPAWYPDVLPPTMDIGPGSPTGVLSGLGAAFPSKYQHAIYAFDWTYGTIYAIHLTPNGSSYDAEKEEFVTGIPLHVTDGVVGKDGSFYFAVGGRGTDSALYRVQYTGNESTELLPVNNPEATNLRELRRSIERFHGKQDKAAVETVWPYLGHEDRFIRFSARVALEHQPVSQWQDRALAETDRQTALSALLALARQGDSSQALPLIQALGQLQPSEMNETEKLETLRVMSLTFIRMNKPNEDLAASIAQSLSPYFPAPSDALNRELISMLVYLNAPDVVAKSVPLMNQEATALEEIEFDNNLLNRSKGYGGSFLNQKASNPQRQQIHYAYALKNIATGWTPNLRKEFFTWFAKAKHFKGGASFGGFIENFRKEALEKISDTEERKTIDALSQAEVKLVPDGYESAERQEIGMLAGMRFNKSTLTVKAGAKVALDVINDDPTKMMHNWALVSKGSLNKVLQAALTLGPKAIELNFVPDIPEVLTSTPQVAPDRKFTLYFTAPTEPGQYPYVCTYPGHGQLMRGILNVLP
ncbi:MAG: heme-binding protein [Verrucomicrobia bacterium]|jgi:azurin|nr:heme-binding protein [Verrucomicrobiota bacterium]